MRTINENGRLAAGNRTGTASADRPKHLTEVRLKGGNQTFECAGQLSEWVGDPLEGANILRHLAIGAGPDPQLIATARGVPGADGHGSERAVGWLLSGDSGLPYEETLMGKPVA